MLVIICHSFSYYAVIVAFVHLMRQTVKAAAAKKKNNKIFN